MIPEVILLNIDQTANKPIPKTAKTDEKTTAKSCNCAPKTNDSIKRAIKKSVTVTYLRISLALASFIPPFFANFVIVKLTENRTISKIKRIIPVAISSL